MGRRMPRLTGDRAVWLVPMAVAAVGRGTYWALVTPDWTPASDANQYARLARFIGSGQGYVEIFPQLELHATAFRPPLYPAVLAPAAWATGPDALWGLRLTTLLLGVAVAGATAVLARRLAAPAGTTGSVTGAVAGLTAGCAAALLPSLVANDTLTLSEPLGLLLVLGVLWALDERRAALAGLLAGLLLLTRPNAYLVVAVVAVTLGCTVGWRRAATSVAVVVLVVTPWLVRNQIQVGTARLTTSDGFNLAAVYAPVAQERGEFVDPVMDPAYDGSEVELLAFDEAAWSAGLTRLALDGLRADPAYPLRVMGRNLGALAEVPPGRNDGPEVADGRNLAVRDATVWTFWLLAVLGSAGLLLRIRDRRTWPLLAVTAQFVVLSLLLISVPRLRAPLDLALCIGLGFLAGEVAARRSSGATAPGRDDDRPGGRSSVVRPRGAGDQTSSSLAMGALSPSRVPSFRMRV